MTTISRRHYSARRTKIRRALVLLVCLSCLLFLVVSLKWLLFGRSETDDTSETIDRPPSLLQSHRLPALRVANKFHNQQRIAILLPFVGQSEEYNRYTAPAYLSLFCAGAAGASEIADFFLFHNGVLGVPSHWDCPPNVKFIDLESADHMAAHLLRVLDRKEDAELAFESREQLRKLVAKHLYIYPYSLVEFKPALGHIFADYIAGYSHWGYSDLDMLYGDLARWITPDEMNDFDIVTYSFGDQHRLYLRGQLTFHKNTPKITQLWRGCEYLTHLDARLAEVVNRKKKYRFESAEGCYSAIVFQHSDIRVKYASKAWTDVHGKDTAYSHGVYLARDIPKNRHVIYKAMSAATGSVLTELSHDWFNLDQVYHDRKLPLQHMVGAMETISLPEDEEANCMYWVQKKYQSTLCLDDASAGRNHTMYWVNGQLYKQKHVNIELQTPVSTAPFFHFQEWKRFFRSSQLATLHSSSTVKLFVLSKEGAIPLPLATVKARWSFFTNGITSPLQIPMKHWSSLHGDRHMLPSQTYCLVSGRRKIPPQPPTSECYYATSWRDAERVKIISQAPQWNGVSVGTDISLVLTQQITKAQATHRQSLMDIIDIAAENLDRWQGQPAVLLLHISGLTESILSFLEERFGAQSDLEFGASNALVAVVHQQEDVVVSRKALLNMATDIVPTRWYISGMELERGLIMSADALQLSHRMLSTQGIEEGRVYVIPQFGLDGESRIMSLKDLHTARTDARLKPLSAFDEACDSDSFQIFKDFDDLWWSLTKTLLEAQPQDSTESIDTKRMASTLNELELSMLRLLTEANHVRLFALDESPILLVDNIGPRNELRTNELVRHVDELGGRRCYNGLQLAQLAAFSYRFHVLEGVFAFSTKETRAAARWGHDHDLLGLSRCDGCYMFGEDEHEEVLEEIVKDEILRPAKAAVLWDEQYETYRH